MLCRLFAAACSEHSFLSFFPAGVQSLVVIPTFLHSHENCIVRAQGNVTEHSLMYPRLLIIQYVRTGHTSGCVAYHSEADGGRVFTGEPYTLHHKK